MPGIARSAAARPARRRSARATSRAARRSVSARIGARPAATSSAGAAPATAAAAGMSRRPVCGQRRPERGDQVALDRDRALERDQLLGDRPGERLPRLGPPPHAQRRICAHRAADQRVVAEALVERPQVVVDAGARSASAARPTRAASSEALRPHEDHAVGDRAASRRRAPAPRRGAAAAGAPLPRRRSSPSSEPPPRRNGHGGCTTSRTRPKRPLRRPPPAPRLVPPHQVDVDEERVARRRSRRSRPCSCAAGARPGCAAGATTATVAAPATKPVAASAAACTAGTWRRAHGLEDARLRDDGEAVDDLPVLAGVCTSSSLTGSSMTASQDAMRRDPPHRTRRFCG